MKKIIKNTFYRPLNWLLVSCMLLTGCLHTTPDVYEWRLQSHAVKESIDFEELLVFAENVKTMSAGRLIIKPHASGGLTSGPDIYSAVQQGRVEMGNGWPNWWSGKHPAWALMNAGPFDFMNIDASMMFFFSGPGIELANSMSKKHGIIWRPAWWPGMEFGLLSKEPITGLADLKGKRVRIGPGLPREVLAAASGAYTIPLMANEIKPALDSGDIDAVEWTTSTGAWDLGLQESSKHAIVPAIWQPSVLSDFLINQAAHDALPQDLQAILESAIKSYTLMTTMRSKVKDFESLKKLQKSGIEITKWTDEDINTWREVSQRVLKEYAKKDPISAQIIKEKDAFKKTYNEYYKWFGDYE